LPSEGENASSASLQEISRWSAVCCGTLLEEHGWKTPKITPTARSIAAKRCPMTTFRCEDAKFFSLGQRVLSDLSLDPAPWPTPSPETYKLHPLAWKVIETTQNDWPKIKLGWLSMLASEGSALQHVPNDGGPRVVIGLVVATSVYGLYTVPLKQAFKIGALAMFCADFSSDILNFTSISDILTYRAIRIRAVPPAEVGLQGGAAPNLPNEVLLTNATAGLTLMQHAAMIGFKTLTAHYLSQLILHLKMKFALGKRPTTEMKMAEALVREAYPDWSDEEVAAAVACRDPKNQRAKEQADIPVLFLEGENLEKIGRALDEEDLKELTRQKKEFLNKHPGGSGGGSGSGGSGGPRSHGPVDIGDAGGDGGQPVPAGGGGASGSHFQPRVDIPLVDDIDIETIRRFLPVIGGCSITKDTIRHYRWVISYPRAAPPFSVSRVFVGEGKCQRSALIFCLQHVWKWHLEDVGAVCPWDFGAEFLVEPPAA
jgi:uncharacterized membrane protein YgcG